MNRPNYDAQMNKIIGSFAPNEKKSLLMHSCCAPCSSACIERVREHFNLTIYYYNPNIDGEEEFNLRANEQKRLCEQTKVEYIQEKFDKAEFYAVTKGLESAIEGGERCFKCFYLRLKRTAEKAKEIGADYFTTTLTVSPLKNAQKINEIGEQISKEVGINFLPCDFKKNGGYLKSVELSKKYGLYRQNYCGCEYSKR